MQAQHDFVRKKSVSEQLKRERTEFQYKNMKFVDLMVFPYFQRRQSIEWKTHISLFQGYKKPPLEQN